MRRALFVLPLLVFALACHRDARPVLNGRVEAYLSDVGPRVGGRLIELKVSEGQRVKAGDLLARVSAEELDAAVLRDVAALDSAEAKRLELTNGTRKEDVAQGEARVRDAQAALKLTEDSLVRTRNLFGEKVMSQSDLDRAQADRDRAEANLHLQEKALAELKAGARVEQRQGALAESKKAKASLDATKAQASFLEIRAPFDAVIIHRLREVGSVLSPGQPVLTIARLDKLWVRVYLPQPLQAQSRVGEPVTVEAPGGRVIEGTLDEVSQEAEYTPKMVETREERVNLVYQARVNLPEAWNQNLLPGVAVDVRLGAPKVAQK